MTIRIVVANNIPALFEGVIRRGTANRAFLSSQNTLAPNPLLLGYPFMSQFEIQITDDEQWDEKTLYVSQELKERLYPQRSQIDIPE